jgi:hypothetical protein
MKSKCLTTLLTGLLAIVVSFSAFAQQDSVKAEGSKKGFKFTMAANDTVKSVANPKGRFVGGITFTRFDIGFTRLVDNGSFSLSPVNDFLTYKQFKSSTVSFDLLDYGYRFNPNFKVYIAAGLDWTMLRLKKDITIKRDTQPLDYNVTGVDFSKNRFSSFYVHVPIGIHFRTNENSRGKRFYFVAGPEVSFLINGKVKQVSKENGKQKFRDDYNFEPVRLGGSLRVGYGWIGFFSKYYFNDMFDSAPQSGLKNMSFGITFGLN